MTLTRQHMVLLAAAGSAAMLLGALGFQYFGGLAPCKLCIWQRWPHGIAVVIGLLAMFLPGRAWSVLGALVVLFGAGVAFYHAGVELKWWQGPTTCTSGPIDGLSTQDLMNQIMNAPIVQCDQVAWSLFGLSMAAWNGIISVGLAGLWALSLRR